MRQIGGYCARVFFFALQFFLRCVFFAMQFLMRCSFCVRCLDQVLSRVGGTPSLSKKAKEEDWGGLGEVRVE